MKFNPLVQHQELPKTVVPPLCHIQGEEEVEEKETNNSPGSQYGGLHIQILNKLLMLPVPLFCLHFLSPVIHNFSNHTLSNSEHYLLSLGLKFRPTPCVLSLNVLNKQLDDLVRSVHLKYFFRDNDSMHFLQFHKLSDWNPPECPPWVEIPLAAIRFELHSLSHCHRRNHVIMMYHPICHVLNCLPWPVSVP